ncbi:MAG TPA: hypothetical protein VMF68_05225 [Spirochaetia bacterium]|nr:hypothetical protein [Spirochaetia bacterium]
MKKRIALFVLAAALLVAAAGCELYQQINLTWSITGVTPLGGNYYQVTYTVQNLGKYDLTGVNLQIGLDVNGNNTLYAADWTPSFSIAQSQFLAGSINLYYTGSVYSTPYRAAVLSVDMDSPSGSKTVIYHKN